MLVQIAYFLGAAWEATLATRTEDFGTTHRYVTNSATISLSHLFVTTTISL